MQRNQETYFKIEAIDSLGQGVSKDESSISFILKTLPGEEGRFEPYKFKKKLSFGVITQPQKLHKVSTERIVPECPHFFDCLGCSYLHTHYTNEINFKKDNFHRELGRKFPQYDNTKTTILAATERTGYRNRIQLHYDLHTNLLGQINKTTNTICPIPKCRLPLPILQVELDKIYKRDLRTLIPAEAPLVGHMELLAENSFTRLVFNGRYSDGGFTQVNETMNLKMKSEIKNNLNKHYSSILDLFGGNGNLSEPLASDGTKRFIVDSNFSKDCRSNSLVKYISSNLYDNSAIHSINKQIDRSIELMIVDPPRSGFENLEKYINTFSPEIVAYISCNYQTQLRDLEKIGSSYLIENVLLVDLFPSTHHIESIIIMRKI